MLTDIEIRKGKENSIVKQTKGKMLNPPELRGVGPRRWAELLTGADRPRKEGSPARLRIGHFGGWTLCFIKIGGQPPEGIMIDSGGGYCFEEKVVVHDVECVGKIQQHCGRAVEGVLAC